VAIFWLSGGGGLKLSQNHRSFAGNFVGVVAQNRDQVYVRSLTRPRTIPIRDWLAASGRRKPRTASMKPGFASNFAISLRTYSLRSAPASRTSSTQSFAPVND